MSGEALACARAALERALAARPRLDGDALTDATKALCAYRDALRRDLEAPRACGRLREVNGVLSLVHAVHFPIDRIPWPLLHEARRGVERLAAVPVSNSSPVPP